MELDWIGLVFRESSGVFVVGKKIRGKFFGSETTVSRKMVKELRNSTVHVIIDSAIADGDGIIDCHLE